MSKVNDIFGKEITVLNIGLTGLAKSVSDQGVKVVDLDWHPPKDGVPRLHQTKSGIDIDAANQEVVERIQRGQAVLVGMGIARDVIPGMHDHMILHAGPPITWERMCGPQRGAVMGALIYEGLAKDEAEAPGWPPRAESSSRPATTITPSGRWRASSPRPCRSSLSRTRPLATRPTAPRTKAWARCCAMAGWDRKCIARLKWMETDLYPSARPRSANPAQWDRHQEPDRPGAAHGRRVPQPQPRRHLPVPARDRPGAGAHQP